MFTANVNTGWLATGSACHANPLRGGRHVAMPLKNGALHGFAIYTAIPAVILSRM